MKSLSKVFLLAIASLACSGVLWAQEKPKTSWLNRARQVSDDLVSDVPRLDKPERILTLARLADTWWIDDPKRSQGWFKRAVDLVSPGANEDPSETKCRLAMARSLLAILANRDSHLSQRLLSHLTDEKHNRDPKDRTENADALAAAATAIVSSNPNTALALGEESLKLGASTRMGQLLWRLRSSSPAHGDKLFQRTIEVASATTNPNLFSVLITAVTGGPFRDDAYKRQILQEIVSITVRRAEPAFHEDNCRIVRMLSQLLSSAETLAPESAQRLRQTYSACSSTGSRNTPSDTDIKPVPSTVEELLKAAADTQNLSERTTYLTKASQLSAANKDYEKAISILDSMDAEVRKSVGAGWFTWRWDFASTAACTYRKTENFQALHRVIDATPPSLRPIAQIVAAMNCDSFSPTELLELMDAARSNMKRVEGADQGMWFLSLVRLYGKLAPETTPLVLSEATAILNRNTSKKVDVCGSAVFEPTVLTSQIVLNQYRLPASLMESDFVGTRQAVRSVERTDIRVALQLNLVIAALAEQRKVSPATSTQ